MIIIRDMTMPKTCGLCPLVNEDFVDVVDGSRVTVIRGCQIGKRYPGKDDSFWYNDRPDWCPLEEAEE